MDETAATETRKPGLSEAEKARIALFAEIEKTAAEVKEALRQATKAAHAERVRLANEAAEAEAKRQAEAIAANHAAVEEARKTETRPHRIAHDIKTGLRTIELLTDAEIAGMDERGVAAKAEAAELRRKAEFKALEDEITPRRWREAITSAEGLAWLMDQDAKITTLRETMQ